MGRFRLVRFTPGDLAAGYGFPPLSWPAPPDGWVADGGDAVLVVSLRQEHAPEGLLVQVERRVDPELPADSWARLAGPGGTPSLPAAAWSGEAAGVAWVDAPFGDGVALLFGIVETL